MALWLMTIGLRSPAEAAAQALIAAGGSVESVGLASDPSRAELDAALDAAHGRRLVIQASTPDLARVLRRMRRRDELATTETAVLPTEPVPFLTRFGLLDLPSSAAIAVGGTCRTVGVLRDDSGNLVIDSAELTPWAGRRVWVRAYVDDDRLCDGEVTRVRIERGTGFAADPGIAVGTGLRATARTGRLWPPRVRPRVLTGRGLTLACDDAAISSDGAGRDQPRRKRIWWDEPDQWRLAVGPSWPTSGT